MKLLFFERVLVLLLIFSVAVLSVCAQKGDPNLDSRDAHFITISATGGVSGYMMMPGIKNIQVDNPIDTLSITSVPFLGGTFGVGYEYHTARGFWLGVGVEGQILTGGLTNTQPIRRIENIMDGNIETGADQSTIEYTIVKWKERERVLMANLPIMFGYKFESGFYFGLGAKVGYTLYGDILGDFGFADCNVYYENTEPLPGLKREISLENVHALDKNFVGQINAAPMFEVGWQGLDMPTGKKTSMRFKFALVGEMGAMGIYSNRRTSDALFEYGEFEGWRPEDLEHLFENVNSFYSVIPLGISSGSFADKKASGSFKDYTRSANLLPWFVGVKVGIMFEMPHPKPCNCLINNHIKPWDKRRKDKGVE